MTYDEDLLVELIACGDVSQTEIAERVGVSRRTVWRIAHGHSRPDLQQKIADTVEGFRRETIRMAAKWMKPLLAKQIKVALEGDGETSRKSREFLLKTFMIVLPEQAAKAARPAKGAPSPLVPVADEKPTPSMMDLPPDLKYQVLKELGGPLDGFEDGPDGKKIYCDEMDRAPNDPFSDREGERFSTTDTTDTTDSTDDTDVEKATVLVSPLSSPVAPPLADQLPVATPPDKSVGDPFANFVDGPHGKKINAASIRAVEEAKAEENARPTRRRVPRSPRE